MEAIEINDNLNVGACPDAVIVWTTEACTEDGETVPLEVHLVLEPAEAIRLANAILHAAANLPKEDFSDVPDELL